MIMPVYASPIEKWWHHVHRLICIAILIFLVAPILVIVPLSFNSEPFFTFPMPGLSLQWYEDIFTTSRWQNGFKNSILIGVSVTVLATALGTLAALGLSRRHFPCRAAVTSLIISPMIVPIVITAVAEYFFFADIRLVNTFPGIVLAHTTLATPLVVITVTASLAGYDHTLSRAAAGLGAPPSTVFLKVTLPLILPGVISGALFAFLTSFNEVVVALFVAGIGQPTLPQVMFSGIREEISPSITAAATVLILFASLVLIAVELLRRRH